METEKIETVKLSVTVPADIDTVLVEFAEEKGISKGEALDRLVVTAIGRLKASRKYAKKMAREGKAEKKAKAPKAAKKAVKKAAPKKAKAPKAAPVEAVPEVESAPLL